MKFLLICDDATFVISPDGKRKTLPASHKVYHQGIARTHGCTVIVRVKSEAA